MAEASGYWLLMLHDLTAQLDALATHRRSCGSMRMTPVADAGQRHLISLTARSPPDCVLVAAGRRTGRDPAHAAGAAGLIYGHDLGVVRSLTQFNDHLDRRIVIARERNTDVEEVASGPDILRDIVLGGE